MRVDFYSCGRYIGGMTRLPGTINLFYPSIRLYIFVCVPIIRLIVIDSVTELTVRRILMHFSVVAANTFSERVN